MSKILGFAKKNIVSLVSILLAVVILVSGIISYAKFITKGKYDGSSGAGFFSYSASIDGVSALSFTNTAFWGGSVEEDQSEENLVAMNAIRTVDFSINNFDDEGNVNAVRTGYTMTFSAPQIFSHSLAFQIVNQDASAMIPQIVLTDIMSKTSFSTSESIDYNGEMYVGNGHDESGNAVLPDALNGNDLYFNVTKTAIDGMVGEYSYTATSTLPDGKVVISVVPRKETKRQLLHFRLWDISSIVQTNPDFNAEGGKLLAPLCITIEEEQIFYDITVTMPAFELPAGVATTNKHTLRLVPTSALHDDHLGGSLKTPLGANATTIYSGQSLVMQTILEKTDVYNNYSGGTLTDMVSTSESPVIGSVKIYTIGNTTTTRNVSKKTVLQIADVASSTTAWTDVSGSEIITYGAIVEGEADPPKNSTGNYWEGGTATQTGTRTRTRVYKQRKTETYAIYEVTTITTSSVATTVLDASAAADSYQESALLQEATTTTVKTETKAVGSVIVTYEREVREISSLEAERTGTYTMDWNGGYTYSYTWNNWPADNSSSWSETSKETQYGEETQINEEQSSTIPSGASDSSTSPTTKTTTVYKQLTRTKKITDITLDKVTYTPIDDSGNPGTTVEYTSSSPFNTHTDGIRKLYVSQCFSKSYPMSVNITFEQRSASDD